MGGLSFPIGAYAVDFFLPTSSASRIRWKNVVELVMVVKRTAGGLRGRQGRSQPESLESMGLTSFPSAEKKEKLIYGLNTLSYHLPCTVVARW